MKQNFSGQPRRTLSQAIGLYDGASLTLRTVSADISVTRYFDAHKRPYWCLEGPAPFAMRREFNRRYKDPRAALRAAITAMALYRRG